MPYACSHTQVEGGLGLTPAEPPLLPGPRRADRLSLLPTLRIRFRSKVSRLENNACSALRTEPFAP